MSTAKVYTLYSGVMSRGENEPLRCSTGKGIHHMTESILILRVALGEECLQQTLHMPHVLQALGDICQPFGDQGLHLVADLGEWWRGETGLPLPLGGNVIRKDLGEDAMRKISRHLRASIAYGLDHRGLALDHAMRYARGLDRSRADTFVGMYVNDWTLDYGARGRDAVNLFLRRGVEAGIITQPVTVEFVD